ncbi:MAG: LacI family transcriptional regulator [Chloroflexia bacterium]|nr:LacI family transcriptional regulator [Chloroflexia bacterium]
MGYYPNIPAFMTKDSRTKVCLIVPEYNKFYTDIIAGAQSYLNKKSVFLYVACSQKNNESEEQIISDLSETGAQGIIISVFDKSTPYKTSLKHINKRIQVVLINNFDQELEANKIVPDLYDGAYKAVNHMYSLGCKKIGLFIGTTNDPFYAEILSGYESALNILGEEIYADRIYISDFKQEDLSHGIDKLIGTHKKLDGLLVGDQLVAQKLIAMLRSMGIQVPEDLLMVSFGDEHFSSYVSPTLSSISISGEKIGQQAAKMIYKKIREQEEQISTEITEAKLIIRGSSMRLRR